MECCVTNIEYNQRRETMEFYGDHSPVSVLGQMDITVTLKLFPHPGEHPNISVPELEIAFNQALTSLRTRRDSFDHFEPQVFIPLTPKKVVGPPKHSLIVEDEE